ncbi:MAG: DNA polymerase IV [Dehalococcoidia bacterium]|nr:DNA polymerase IV [Dehalococcoidia bacterium]
MIRCIFHVDLDAFFVSVEQLHDPSLKGKPVIVGGHPGTRGVVAAASYEARSHGVHSAMPLVQAQRLCPRAIFVPTHFGRYVEASGRFMELLDSMAPVTEPLSLDEAFLDMTDVCPDFKESREYAQSLKQRVRDELGLVASVGVAPCKIVAKVASDYDKPDGLVLVLPGEEAAFLAGLPAGKLPGVGPKTGQILRELGVETIGQLAALSPGAAHLRLGRYGDLLRQHAQGIDNSKVEPRGEAKSMSRETTFQTDTRDVSLLHKTLRSMCEHLARDLHSHKKRAATVTLKLRYEDFQTVTRQSSLREQSDMAGTFFDAASALLWHLLSANEQRIRLIGVRVSRLSGPECQLDMFSPEVQRTQNLEQAIARINRRFGEGAIRTGRSI